MNTKALGDIKISFSTICQYLERRFGSEITNDISVQSTIIRNLLEIENCIDTTSEEFKKKRLKLEELGLDPDEIGLMLVCNHEFNKAIVNTSSIGYDNKALEVMILNHGLTEKTMCKICRFGYWL